VRRPEGDGARRLLCCGLCGAEWQVNRIRCPACGEEDPPRLPSFQSEAYPAARIEACDTCMRYVKSIDLSRDGRLIPEVDELASLGLDLWAREQGYTRIEPGLAGL
jgi:FdhE protein